MWQLCPFVLRFGFGHGVASLLPHALFGFLPLYATQRGRL